MAKNDSVSSSETFKPYLRLQGSNIAYDGIFVQDGPMEEKLPEALPTPTQMLDGQQRPHTGPCAPTHSVLGIPTICKLFEDLRVGPWQSCSIVSSAIQAGHPAMALFAWSALKPFPLLVGRRVPAEPSLHREDFQARSLLHSATAVSLGSGIPKRAQMKRRPLFVVPREPTVLS